MKQRIEVRTQAEFDACVKIGNIAICVGGGFFIARENSSVEAWENSSVVAWGNSSVEARESVFIRLFSALKIKASAYVAIMVQGSAKELVGGRQLQPAPVPADNAKASEWRDYYGIDVNAPYKVENLDAKILTAIETKQGTLDMGVWHGDKCDADNWCGTTHCRAGYAICLAGKAGFELERKMGSEMAGRFIYAVSRPDMPLPDFFATTGEALDDIRESAGLSPQP